MSRSQGLSQQGVPGSLSSVSARNAAGSRPRHSVSDKGLIPATGHLGRRSVPNATARFAWPLVSIWLPQSAETQSASSWRGEPPRCLKTLMMFCFRNYLCIVRAGSLLRQEQDWHYAEVPLILSRENQCDGTLRPLSEGHCSATLELLRVRAVRATFWGASTFLLRHTNRRAALMETGAPGGIMDTSACGQGNEAAGPLAR